MNRYDKIQIRNTDRGRRYRSTVKYPIIRNKPTDIYIIGRIGDRLDNLSYMCYGDTRFWWIIARANNIGKGDLNVPNGIQLRIPQEHLSVIDEYNKINS